MSHPSAIVSYVFSIAKFITDKENRLLKRVSEVGSQLGLQQREGTRSWLEHGQTVGCLTHRVATK